MARPEPAHIVKQLARHRPKRVRPAHRLPKPSYDPPGADRGNLRTGIAGRVWMGEPGRSELVSGKLVLQDDQVVDQADQEEATREMTRRIALEMAREIHTRWGLEISHDPEMPPLSRFEYLVLLTPDQENEARLQAFVEGWSGHQLPGVRAANLSPMQVQELGRILRRRLGGPDQQDQMPVVPGDPHPE